MNLGFVAQLWDQLSSAEKVALLGAIVVWLVYRADRWSQRRGLLVGVVNEVSLHKPWIGNAYPANLRGSFKDPTHMVYKVGTVAIDDAIVRGASLLLNRQLFDSLVVYRQVVGNFNQLIDQAMSFQANPELWTANPPQGMVDHMLELIEGVHLLGIGDLTNKASHWMLVKQVEPALDDELASQVVPVIWAVTGVNLFFLRHWEEWL